MTPAATRPGSGNAWRPLAAGLAALVVDWAVFRRLDTGADALAKAHVAGFFAGLAAAAALLALTGREWRSLAPSRAGAIATAVLLALFLRGGLLASLVDVLAVPVAAAHLAAAALTLAALYAAWRWFAGPVPVGADPGEVRWDRFVAAVVVYAVALRFVYLGVPELLFEEAYYWNYAKHLDIGYLDHPLVVAWIIRGFDELLGNGEIAVRAGAFACWLVTAFFSWRLTRDVLGRAAASRALALVAVLPVFFFFGLFMSPDAPLAAAWSAALYLMHRIVVRDDRRAWLWLGVAIGLGMSSKYTIALLAAAFVLFVAFDRTSRRWLARPEPYVAVAIALALFSPAIVWNWQQQWISFAFQSQDRLASRFAFSLPRFAANVVALLTPTGVVAVVAFAVCRREPAAGVPMPADADASAWLRSRALLAWLTFAPLAVFAALSVARASKLNWTGPLWLGAIPFLALLATPGRGATGVPRVVAWCRRAWPPTLVICLLAYGAALHWLGPGLPGVGYPQNVHLIGWRDFGRDVERLVETIERETGKDVLVVGMDRNRIASGLAYYRTRALDTTASAAARGDPAFDTATENLFGGIGLMYRLWFPAGGLEGRTMLLVAKDAARLEGEHVTAHAESAGPIGSIDVRKNGRPAGRYHYRVVTGYRPGDEGAGAAEGSDRDD